MRKISDAQWRHINAAPTEFEYQARFEAAEKDQGFVYSLGKNKALNEKRRLESLKKKEAEKDKLRKKELEMEALAQKIKRGNPSKRPRKLKKRLPTVEERLSKLEAVR